MENVCATVSLNKSTFCGGDVVCACLRFSPLDLDSFLETNDVDKQRKFQIGSTIKLQVLGIVSIEHKWLRMSNLSEYFQDSSVTAAEDAGLLESLTSKPSSPIISNNNITTEIFFKSSIASVDYNNDMTLTGEGLVIQFELPADSLPTQKGLGYFISYSFCVEMQNESKAITSFNMFPVQVSNLTPIIFPYIRR